MSRLFKNTGLCLNQESDLLLYMKLLINFNRALSIQAIFEHVKYPILDMQCIFEMRCSTFEHFNVHYANMG